MSVIRIEKTKDYTVMSNYHFREKEMSLKAKGLLSLMLSLPEKWDYSIAGLVAICKENETSIKSALDELKQFGYLEVIKRMPNETKTGRIEYEYIVYEQKQDLEKQDLENQGVEFQGIENPIQLNINNKKLINKELINSFGFTENCISAINDWLQYKKEKKQSYQPKGLETLCKRLYQMQKDNGEQYLINSINHSMANNYAGVYPDNKSKPKDKNKQPVKREYTKEEYNNMYDNIFDVEI